MVANFARRLEMLESRTCQRTAYWRGFVTNKEAINRADFVPKLGKSNPSYLPFLRSKKPPDLTQNTSSPYNLRNQTNVCAIIANFISKGI